MEKHTKKQRQINAKYIFEKAMQKTWKMREQTHPEMDS
jgi:hypothetical protein